MGSAQPRRGQRGLEPRRRDPAGKQASLSQGLSRVLSGFGIDEPATSQRVTGSCRGERL